jgi:hypothetical protein
MLHRKLQQQDCGSCETIFYSAFRNQLAAADSWRVYNLQYKIQYRIQNTEYRIQNTGIQYTGIVIRYWGL